MSPKYTDLVLSGSPNLRKDTNNIHVESGTGAEARNGLPGWGLYRSVTPLQIADLVADRPSDALAIHRRAVLGARAVNLEA